MSLDIQKYLYRIGYKTKPKVSLDCLAHLQACHQLTVPFENLEVFVKRKKLLKVDVLYERIVLEHRGGWCCELNGLFAWLLRQIGFEVKLVSCSHYNVEKDVYDETFDHMAIVVNLEEADYLVDVGYGFANQQIQPIQICTDKVYEEVNCDVRFHYPFSSCSFKRSVRENIL